MPKLTNDMVRAAKESGAIKPGKYLAALESVKVSYAKETGNEMWNWQFELVGDHDYQGRKVFDRAVLTDAAAWKLNDIYGAFDAPVGTDTDEMIGLLISVEIDNEDYDGRTMNRIVKYYRPETKLAGDTND